ncbi:MAG: hypothetical protein BWY44_00149 [Candidatus Omnitrophica bacterium ADurb.Bin292]|nr:MAG: hypothetical protein BWY44_00149 [Candidatus Omnitrophica bacterium ADurb.Bin292]
MEDVKRIGASQFVPSKDKLTPDIPLPLSDPLKCSFTLDDEAYITPAFILTLPVGIWVSSLTLTQDAIDHRPDLSWYFTYTFL